MLLTLIYPTHLLRHFSARKMSDRRNVVFRGRGVYIYGGETFRDGFLEKEFKLNNLVRAYVRFPSLPAIYLAARDGYLCPSTCQFIATTYTAQITDGVNPTLDEISKFAAPTTDDPDATAQSLVALASSAADARAASQKLDAGDLRVGDHVTVADEAYGALNGVTAVVVGVTGEMVNVRARVGNNEV